MLLDLLCCTHGRTTERGASQCVRRPRASDELLSGHMNASSGQEVERYLGACQPRLQSAGIAPGTIQQVLHDAGPPKGGGPAWLRLDGLSKNDLLSYWSMVPTSPYYTLVCWMIIQVSFCLWMAPPEIVAMASNVMEVLFWTMASSVVTLVLVFEGEAHMRVQRALRAVNGHVVSRSVF